MDRTAEKLQNVTVDLSTHGDLRLVGRLQPIILSPQQQQVLNTAIKASSSETGVILG